MKKPKQNFIDKAIELDTKQTPSDKLFNRVGLICGSVACGFLVLCLIFHLTLPSVGFFLWLILFYPILVLVIVTLSCSIGQLIRNHYFSALFACILGSLALLALIITIIYQAAVYSTVFLIPFHLPPVGWYVL